MEKLRKGKEKLRCAQSFATLYCWDFLSPLDTVQRGQTHFICEGLQWCVSSEQWPWWNALPLLSFSNSSTHISSLCTFADVWKTVSEKPENKAAVRYQHWCCLPSIIIISIHRYEACEYKRSQTKIKPSRIRRWNDSVSAVNFALNNEIHLLEDTMMCIWHVSPDDDQHVC